MTLTSNSEAPTLAPGRRRWHVALASVTVGALVLSTALLLRAQAPAGGRPLAATDGKALYDRNCARCHGAAGKGDGEAAEELRVKPRDFTAGRFKLRTTESGALPTDDDLLKTIKSGMHGSSMPDWAPFLTDGQIQSIIAYVKTFSPRFAAETAQPIKVVDPPPTSPDSVTRGKAVYERLKCASCHGTDGTLTGAVTTEFKDDLGRDIAAPKLTEPWTFRGGSTARDVYLRFRTGMNGAPMPSFKDAATDVEMGHLANYVVSLARKPVWETTGEDTASFYRDLNAQERADPLARGRYLLSTLGCAYCHTPLNADGTSKTDLSLAGGQKLLLYPFTTVVTYNLTSDRQTGLGAWTDAQIKGVITRGTRPDGSRMLPFPMPWTSYGNMKPEDVDALVAALRSLPPVSNAIPAPDDPSLLPYLWGKFQVLILKRDVASTSSPGNAGTLNGGKSWQTPAQ